MRPPALPKSYSTIVIPKESPLAVDGSDFTCGILKQMMDTYFRVAQLGFTVQDDQLEIVNLQGSGPVGKYRSHKLDPKKTYDKLKSDLKGIKPINALVGVLAMLAKRDPRFRRIVSGRMQHFGTLRYETILKAAKFREAPPSDMLVLDLSLDERAILQRITGADQEKHERFTALLEDFRVKLVDCFCIQ